VRTCNTSRHGRHGSHDDIDPPPRGTADAPAPRRQHVVQCPPTTGGTGHLPPAAAAPPLPTSPYPRHRLTRRTVVPRPHRLLPRAPASAIATAPTWRPDAVATPRPTTPCGGGKLRRCRRSSAAAATRTPRLGAIAGAPTEGIARSPVPAAASAATRWPAATATTRPTVDVGDWPTAVAHGGRDRRMVRATGRQCGSWGGAYDAVDARTSTGRCGRAPGTELARHRQFEDPRGEGGRVHES